MIISLVQTLRDYSRFLQKILLDFCSFYHPLLVEMNVDVLSKARRIVVSYRFGIAERYERETIDKVNNFCVFVYRDATIERAVYLPRWDSPPKFAVRSKNACH